MRWALVVLAGCSFRHGVDQPSPPDAGDIALQCPSTYDVSIAGSTSRYRIITTEGVFSTLYSACNADLPGSTHLVAFETADEIDAIQAALGTHSPQAASGEYFVGAVQKASQSAPDAGWLVFTGGALPTGCWAPNEPDDSGTNETNQENLGGISMTDEMHDTNGVIVHGGVCECDGHGVDPAVAALIPAT
jgi:hypothetical protein